MLIFIFVIQMLLLRVCRTSALRCNSKVFVAFNLPAATSSCSCYNSKNEVVYIEAYIHLSSCVLLLIVHSCGGKTAIKLSNFNTVKLLNQGKIVQVPLFCSLKG